MHFIYLVSTLAAVAGLTAATADPALIQTRETCSTPNGSGTCMATGSCGTFSVAGYCSGGNDNQCCVSKTCSTSKGSGTCKNTKNGCSGGSFIAGACPGDSSVQCCVETSTTPPTTPPSGGDFSGLTSVQIRNAKAILVEAKSEGLGKQGCLAGIATAVVESGIRILANNAVPASLNYPHDGTGSDHDSIGIFQQRVSYYPNIAADMDAAKSAAQFFKKMKAISGWQTMDVGKLCQKVQVSAFPTAYNEKGLPVAKKVCNGF